MSLNLSLINAEALLNAIAEFDNLGRRRFLRKYGYSRASKFFLIYGQRIYDTKPLIGAAYRYAARRKAEKFRGGAQTKAVFRRIMKQDRRFSKSKIFEDSLGELRHLSGEFDRLMRAHADLRKLGFSSWIPLRQYGLHPVRLTPA